MTKARDIFRSLRPNQWTKNAVVLAAIFFAFGDRSLDFDLLTGLVRVFPAMLLFCAASSGVYLLNDVRDIDADRRHPLKKYRPIAAGRVSVSAATQLAIVLLIASLGLAQLLSPAFAIVLCVYVLLQVLYIYGLKRIALLDVLVIASGFVLRAVAGAVVLDVPISPWLLLCAFLLSLFLALCKRRHELVLQPEGGVMSRPSLASYDERLLDQLISITASSTVVAYAMYTLSPRTIQKFGGAGLGFTIPFVLFGIFRYLDLAYRHEKGDRPEKILLTDGPILFNLALYAICVVIVFLLGR